MLRRIVIIHLALVATVVLLGRAGAEFPPPGHFRWVFSIPFVTAFVLAHIAWFVCPLIILASAFRPQQPRPEVVWAVMAEFLVWLSWCYGVLLPSVQ